MPKQVIALSATIGGADSVAAWLHHSAVVAPEAGIPLVPRTEHAVFQRRVFLRTLPGQASIQHAQRRTAFLAAAGRPSSLGLKRSS